MRRRIRHIGFGTTLLLGLLGLRLIYWQVVRGDDLSPAADATIHAGNTPPEKLVKTLEAEALAQLGSLPQPVIQRTEELLSTVTRGTLYDRHGTPLAYDETTAVGGRRRVYPLPVLAPVLGYVSGLRIGVAGVELAFNEPLLGLDRLNNRLRQELQQPITGNDVYLTLDAALQQIATAALGDRRGAIVVMDGHSGEILTLASTPSYDPNRMLETEYAAGLANCLDPACGSPLLNRATQGLYTPGSTWKTVTLIAALDSGLVQPQTVFDFGRRYNGPEGGYYIYAVDGAVFEDPNHDESRLDLTSCFAVSANAAFARMGDEMAPETFIAYAQRLGFGSGETAAAPPIETPATPGYLAQDLEEFRSNNVLQAATGFGQGELLASPLNMALVVAAVVNDGHVPRPHLLGRIQTPSGDVIGEQPDSPWISSAMRPETAAQVREMMLAVVSRGSGVYAAVPGLTVGGKTGTAEVGTGQPPHAWFIGFAGDGQRTLVIVVLVENGGQGADVAAPIFAQVARSAFGR